jgi:hypothetical protein
MDVVPGMDGFRIFRYKTGSWGGSTPLQIIPTSRVVVIVQLYSNTIIAVLRDSADSNRLEHKAATVHTLLHTWPAR